MDLPVPLIPTTFLRRYKRFLADFQAPDGTTITAHCANSGSMLGLLHPGAPAMLSRSDNPQRKLAYTWELIQENNTWVGIHTGRTNAIVHEALAQKALPAFRDYGKIQSEVSVGEKSRLDFRLDGENLPPCFLEVKSVTLRQGDVAAFPDAVTTRGRRHLEELTGVCRLAQSPETHSNHRMDLKAMSKKEDQRMAAMIAKITALLCVRNTRLEALHAGRVPFSKVGDCSDVKVVDAEGYEIPWNEVSHFDDAEMKLLMKQIVNRLYTFQVIADDPDMQQIVDRWSSIAATWDEPEIDGFYVQKRFGSATD